MIVAASVLLMLAQRPSPLPPDTYVDLPGVRVRYKDSGGSGQAVVFLHAATGSSDVWEHQAGAFAAAGYRVIAYDRRGWGRSTIDTRGPQPGTGADDLAALLDHLQLDRVHLVATAAGGFVALDFALSFPNRLRTLVVANSIGGVQDEDYVAQGRRLRPPQFDALPPDLKELGPSYRAANPAGTARWLELGRQSRPEGPRAAAQPTKNQITLARLKAIKTPTLILTGVADLYAPPPVMKLIADRIKGAAFHVIPEAGHSAYWERPDDFNRTVLEFIRRHGQA